MKIAFCKYLGVLACLWGMAAPALAGELARSSYAIPDIENRIINYHVERLDADHPVPLLIVIDGSGCAGVLRPGFSSLYSPSEKFAVPYAKLTVDKPGIDPHATDPRDCPEEYHQRRSIDRAVLDHLRVLAHLRSHADWWDGRIFIWGWSEGGDVGARLVAYSPEVERAVLGAMGGGLTMAQHFEDYWDCAADRVEDRDACLTDVRAMFEDVRDNPVPRAEKGDSNLLWRSRMFADLATLLRYGRTPIMVVHGALDRDNTPVQSSRVLINRLSEYGRGDIAYCEVPFMQHGTGSLTPEQGLAFEEGLLEWLFGLEQNSQTLQPFCDPSPPLDRVAPPSATLP